LAHSLEGIEPWYDYVEDFAGISGQAEGLPQLIHGGEFPHGMAAATLRLAADAAKSST